MINKIGRPRSGSPIFLITSMIIDRIGQHEVLLPIDHDFKKNCDIEDSFWTQNTRNSKIFFATNEKRKLFKRARDGVYYPITETWRHDLSIKWHGIGRRTVSKVIRHDLGIVEAFLRECRHPVGHQWSVFPSRRWNWLSSRGLISFATWVIRCAKGLCL